MSRPEDDDGFLSRWSRRKQAAVHAKPEAGSPDGAPPPITTSGNPSPVVSAGPSDATPNLNDGEKEAELPLPSLNDIVPGGDVTAFMQKHVPDALRNAALRKMWLTDPDIRDFIEMADYQWDFNNPDSIPGWSSKLEGIDVKAMVERIFAAPPPQAPDDGPSVLAEAAPQGNETHAADIESGIGNSAETPVKSVTSGPESAAPSADVIQNGALQNNTKESSVYDGLRKRHGGALPT